MKITRDTPDQLILENNPLWLAVIISVFGLIFVAGGLRVLGEDPVIAIVFIGIGLAIGLGFNMIFVRRTQLILDAGRNLVELRRRGWLGYSAVSWDLTYLDRAVVQTSRSEKSETHRAALVISGGMDAGTHPITLVYTSGHGAARAASAINAWHAALDSSPSKA